MRRRWTMGILATAGVAILCRNLLTPSSPDMDGLDWVRKYGGHEIVVPLVNKRGQVFGKWIEFQFPKGVPDALFREYHRRSATGRSFDPSVGTIDGRRTGDRYLSLERANKRLQFGIAYYPNWVEEQIELLRMRVGMPPVRRDVPIPGVS